LSCVSVVMASEGYPETSISGRPITGNSIKKEKTLWLVVLRAGVDVPGMRP